jgi:hypothetical protein
MGTNSSDTKRAPMIEFECESCGSPRIAFDALAVWSKETQEFELLDAYPDSAPPVCHDCGSEDYREIQVHRPNGSGKANSVASEQN